MTVDQAKPIVVEVDIAIAVQVPEIGTLAALMNNRIGREIAEIARKPARQAVARPREECGRAGGARPIGLFDAVDRHDASKVWPTAA